jgi:hypothetical protein
MKSHNNTNSELEVRMSKKTTDAKDHNKSDQTDGCSRTDKSSGIDVPHAASSNSLIDQNLRDPSGATAAGALRVTVAADLIAFVSDELPNLKLSAGDKRQVKKYLTSLELSDAQQVKNGLDLVTTAVSIKDRTVSNHLTVPKLLQVAESLMLRPWQLTEFACLAERQDRSVLRVASFIKELAVATRTDDRREAAFQEATPEQQDKIFTDALELMQAAKECEASLGITISLKKIARLVAHASVDEVIRELEELSDAELHGTRYQHLRERMRRSILLNDFVEWIENNPEAPFRVEEFLEEARKNYRLRVEDEDAEVKKMYRFEMDEDGEVKDII